MQVDSDATRFHLATTTGPGVNATGYTKLPIVIDESGVAFTNNQVIGFLFFVLSAGGGVTDHGALTGLTDDDHPQYVLLAGRAGGQFVNGGTAATEELNLRGSTDADLGQLHFHSPTLIDFDLAVTPVPVALDYDTVSTVGSFNGGFIRSRGTITTTAAVFIWSLLAELKTYDVAAAPGFAAFTLFNVLPLIQNSGNFNLFSALVLNVGVTHARASSGTSTSAGCVGMNFSPQTRARISGAVMTKTGDTAIRVSPVWNTLSGGTVNMGTIMGMDCYAPAQALFGNSSGVENKGPYYGLNFQNITNINVGDTVAVRSAMTAGATRYFLQNNGGAKSDFGGGDIFDTRVVQCLTDGFGLSLGAAGGDLQYYWDGSAGVMNPLVGDNLEWLFFAGAHTLQSENFGSGSEARFGFEKFAFGQTSAVGNQVGIFVAASGRLTNAPGDYADWLFTNAGNLDLDGNAMSQVFAASYSAPSMTLNGGSVVDAGVSVISGGVNEGTNRYGLLVLSNPTGGTLNYCARFQGAAGVRIDGPLIAIGSRNRVQGFHRRSAKYANYT